MTSESYAAQKPSKASGFGTPSIQTVLRQRVPETVAVLDVTDHEAGTAPFCAPGKR